MKILITGASGFIGGRLAEYLNKKKLNVALASRYKKNFKNYKYKKINWKSDKSLKKLCKNIDVIINCAGFDSHKCKNKSESIAVNSKQPSRLLKAANNAGVSFFIHLSSAHIYKNNLVGNINEKTKIKTTHIHGLSKLDGENKLKKIDDRNTKLLILRPSNLFGYPVNKKIKCWHLLINSLVKDLALHNKAKILSKKNVYRNYSSLESFCNFIYFLLKKHIEKSFYLPQVVNYCSEYNLTLIDLANIIKKRFSYLNKNKQIKINFKHAILLKSKKLVYKSIYAKKLNFSNDKNFIKEIDNLILYCVTNF